MSNKNQEKQVGITETVKKHGGQAYGEFGMVIPDDPQKGIVILPKDTLKISPTMEGKKNLGVEGAIPETVDAPKTDRDLVSILALKMFKDIQKCEKLGQEFARVDSKNNPNFEQSRFAASTRLSLIDDKGNKETMYANLRINSIAKEPTELFRTPEEKALNAPVKYGKPIYFTLECKQGDKSFSIALGGALDQKGNLITRDTSRQVGNDKIYTQSALTIGKETRETDIAHLGAFIKANGVAQTREQGAEMKGIQTEVRVMDPDSKLPFRGKFEKGLKKLSKKGHSYKFGDGTIYNVAANIRGNDVLLTHQANKNSANMDFQDPKNYAMIPQNGEKLSEQSAEYFKVILENRNNAMKEFNSMQKVQEQNNTLAQNQVKDQSVSKSTKGQGMDI